MEFNLKHLSCIIIPSIISSMCINDSTQGRFLESLACLCSFNWLQIAGRLPLIPLTPTQGSKIVFVEKQSFAIFPRAFTFPTKGISGFD